MTDSQITLFLADLQSRSALLVKEANTKRTLERAARSNGDHKLSEGYRQQAEDREREAFRLGNLAIEIAGGAR